MENESYEISEINKYVYDFNSIGKKTLIKRIIFTAMDGFPDIYNLALGTIIDYDIVDFKDNSNNGDIVKVFNTIILCIKMFTKKYPNNIVFFKGNTNQKTRVYNEILRRHFDDFTPEFTIFGLVLENGEHNIQPFEVGKNYTGFFITKK